MSAFSDEQKRELDKPLLRANVKDRTQAGRKLSYVEGWVAIAEANRIFGFDGWTSETVDLKLVAERERKIGSSGKDGWSVSYIAKVRIVVNGVTREGVGAGHGIDVDLGLAHESAIKEAETDARKRGLMTFGNPFGLALYDKEQTNVANAPQEPSSDQLYMDHSFQKIAAFTAKTALSNWWKAETENRHRMLTPAQAKQLLTAVTARGEALKDEAA